MGPLRMNSMPVLAISYCSVDMRMVMECKRVPGVEMFCSWEFR